MRHGYGWADDLAATEGGGCLPGADPARVSPRALARGREQLGTLGSGNHYLEIQVAKPADVFDAKVAAAFGIHKPDQVVVMFHCGSRGFGHQVATDYLQRFLKVMQPRYGIPLIDRELACAPFASPEGQDYFAAMKCGINMSFANRQVILHRIREVFSDVFGRSPEELGLEMVYDVAHNIAKLERHRIGSAERELLVHRKGATRAFPPGHPDVPERYRQVGQPVFVPGDMGRYSYVAVGAPGSMEGSFGSTCHGAGRLLSRHAAIKSLRGRDIHRELASQGVIVRAERPSLLAEEASPAYKDVTEVVRVAERAGQIRSVARLRPLAVIKG